MEFFLVRLGTFKGIIFSNMHNSHLKLEEIEWHGSSESPWGQKC